MDQEEPPLSAGHLIVSAPRKPRRSKARKRADFLRHLRCWGSFAEAAARTGVDARTARRWREDPEFERLCWTELAWYIERVEGEAYRRVMAPDVKPVVFRGRQVGQVVRFNDTMLMRLLQRMPIPPQRRD